MANDLSTQRVVSRSSSSKSRRARVKTVEGDTVKVQPRTPLSLGGHSGGADAAFALAEALKGGIALGEMRNTKKAAQAKADFQRGAIDEKEGNQAYRRSVESLKAKARWIEDEAEFDEAFEDVDKRDLTLKGLNEAIDGIFAAKYGDLDDPVIANAVLKNMEAYRQRKIDEVLKIQDEAELAEVGSAITTIAEDAYVKGHAEDGSFSYDYEQINSELQEAMPGGAGNDVLFNVYSDIAIRNGDVDFFRNIPERWADGTPTFKSNPDYNEKVLAAENRAIAVAAANAKKDADREEALNDENLRVISMAAVDAAAAGDYDSAKMISDQYRSLPGADPTKAIALEKAADSLVNIVEERGANERNLGALAANVYSGMMGEVEIYEAYINDEFGTGKQATERMRTLLAVAAANKKRSTEGSAKNYSVYATSIREAYKPDRLIGMYDETLAAMQNAALREYHELTLKGISPIDANFQIREKYDPKTPAAASFKQNNAFSPMEAIQERANGRMSTFEMKEAGVTIEHIDALVESKQLTVEQAKELLSSY